MAAVRPRLADEPVRALMRLNHSDGESETYDAKGATMKILAATDGSRHAEYAVRFAAWLASRFRGGRLEVVIAGDVGLDLLEGSRRVASPAMEKQYRRWATGALERGAKLARPFGVKTTCRYLKATRLAPIARVISDAADASRADLVVVGSAGRGTVGRAVFGSVARGLLGIARKPVVVVPARVTGGRGEALRLLAATDGSRGSSAAIRCAASLARNARRSRLEIVTIGTLRHDLALGPSPAVLKFLRIEELRAAERAAADRILGRGAREARRMGVEAAAEFLEPRTSLPVADVLAREAGRRGAHLVAVGTTGRGRIERWALGSVTRRLITGSRRPVLVVQVR
jgi:nucleotide-binding universal stress UspA family protein